MIYIYAPKPATKKDFEYIAACMRAAINQHSGYRITFDISGYRITCNNTPHALTTLATRLEKFNRITGTQKYRGHRAASYKEILARYKDDAPTYSEFLKLFNRV